jgi:membrane fusion protein (multidrug efflux system)
VLRPGQYGRVRAATGIESRALVVPQRAITDLQGGYQLRVLGPGNHVAVRPVTVGDRVGNLQIITSGVKAGEQVIVGAPTAVRDGSVVTPKPFTQTEG